MEDLPEPEEEDCTVCDGEGVLKEVGPDGEDRDCPVCDGQGSATPEEPTEEQMAQWQEQAWEAFSDALSNCPV